MGFRGRGGRTQEQGDSNTYLRFWRPQFYQLKLCSSVQGMGMRATCYWVTTSWYPHLRIGYPDVWVPRVGCGCGNPYPSHHRRCGYQDVDVCGMGTTSLATQTHTQQAIKARGYGMWMCVGCVPHPKGLRTWVTSERTKGLNIS